MDTEALTLVKEFVSKNPEWEIVDNKIYKKFEFNSFVEAFGFMSMVAIEAEKMNHHPEWSNVYRYVDVYLTTHEENKVTSLDFELAKKIDMLKKDL